MSNMVVRTNVLALNSHRNLGMVGTQQARASARLSSGFRINSAADDAAGLGISEKMRSQIRGLNQASRNAQDGISLIQTAEGAMSTINEMIARIRELVVQAANDTNAHDDQNASTWSQSDRSRIQGEIDQLMLEIDATVHRTQFNTRLLIDGSLGGDPPAGALPENALDMFPAAAFTANAFTAGALAAGFDWIDGTSQGAATAAFEAAIADLVGYTGPGAGLNAAVTTWLENFDSTLDLTNLTGTDITNLAELFDADPSTYTGAEETLVANAQEALMDALNAVDLSNYVERVNVEPSVTNAFATAFAFTANAIPTAGNLELATGFSWIGTSDAAALHTALDAAITALGTVDDWLDGFNDIASDGHAANFAALFAAGVTNTDVLEARDALLDILNGVLAEHVRFGEEEELVAGQGLWFQVGANRGQGVNLSIQDVGVHRLSSVGAELGTIGPGRGQIPTGFTFADLWSGSHATNTQSMFIADTVSDVEGRQVLNAESAALGYIANQTEGRGVLNRSGEEISQFLTAIDFALSHATAERSNLGAMQNRLEFTIQNLDIASENLSASESRIRDADMALEMMRLTQANVLQQAATAMLAQANQAPQSILQLLG